jgi:hypothetical protein
MQNASSIVEWELPASNFKEQLSKSEQNEVASVLEHLFTGLAEEGADHAKENLTEVLLSDGRRVDIAQAGADLRVIIEIRDGKITVVDIVRHSQLAKLRNLRRSDVRH